MDVFHNLCFAFMFAILSNCGASEGVFLLVVATHFTRGHSCVDGYNEIDKDIKGKDHVSRRIQALICSHHNEVQIMLDDYKSSPFV